MAVAPNTNINIPYSPFLNDQTGRPNTEWLQWLMNPSFITLNLGSALPVTSGGTGLTTIPTNGQLLIGNGTGYTLNPLTPGVGIGVTNGAGLITVANSGVLSNIAGTGISVSNPTGNVTIGNTGVLSWSGGSTGLTPATATTGVVTLAGTLGAGYGGTGLNTYVIGDLLYASGTTAFSRLADIATGNAVISGGIATAPSWGKIGLTTHVSGTLPIGNGGTNGAATATAGAVAYGTGTAYAFTAAGTLGQVLTSAAAGTPTWATPTTGTVTAVSVVSANGLAGTSSGGATPALTLSTTVTGVVKGNGTALSAAVAATDYVAPSAYASANGLTMATSRLLGRTTASTGAAEEISVAGGLTLSAGTLTGTSGTVTSVAALTLGTTGTDLSSTVANGTTTPVITLQVPTASAANRGALSSTDWTTFNNKGSGSVTSVGFTGGIITVANPTTTPAFTVAGTSGGVPYFSSASTWATSAALAASALVVGGGAGAAPATITTGTGVVTALGVNTGTAGAFVVNGGALGTPSSGTVTNLTGTASININGTVGATTANTGAFTTITVTKTSNYDVARLTAPDSPTLDLYQSAQNNASARNWRVLTNYEGWGTLDIQVGTTSADAPSATRFSLARTGILTLPGYGVGTATFSSAGVISSVSDETWKVKDGVPVGFDAMLNKLEPGYWYYNDEKKETFGVDRQLGFYAQNVNAAIGPEAAPEPEEGKPWGYYDRSVLAVTVMSLQKALATIELLTDRINALEAKCL